jgi:hypothetical protein
MTDLDQKEQEHVRMALRYLYRNLGGWAALSKALGWAAVAPARESRPTPLAVWCEERHRRWGWSWRSRVAVYLHAVEGLPVYEVAGLLGLSAEAMEKHLNDRLPAWRRRAGVYPGRWPDRYSGAAAVDWDAD